MGLAVCPWLGSPAARSEVVQCQRVHNPACFTRNSCTWDSSSLHGSCILSLNELSSFCGSDLLESWHCISHLTAALWKSTRYWKLQQVQSFFSWIGILCSIYYLQTVLQTKNTQFCFFFGLYQSSVMCFQFRRYIQQQKWQLLQILVYLKDVKMKGDK